MTQFSFLELFLKGIYPLQQLFYISLLLPVFIENRVSWLGLVLHCFLVHGLGLFIHPPLFKLLCPGHIEGSGPGADALTVDVSVKRHRVGIKTRL